MQVKNILIISNEASEASALARAFEANRMPTFVFASGHEALTAVRNMKLALAIGCITLPGENILEIFRSLNARPGQEEIPCVLILPAGAEYSPDEVLAYGIVDAFMRPVDASEAVNRVRTHLGLPEPGAPGDSHLGRAVETALSEPQGRKASPHLRPGMKEPSEQMSLLDADTGAGMDVETEEAAGSPRFHREGQVFDDPVDKLNADLKRSVQVARRNKILAISLSVLFFGGLAVVLFTGGNTGMDVPPVEHVRETMSLPEQTQEALNTQPDLSTSKAGEPFGEILRQELDGTKDTGSVNRTRSGGGEVVPDVFFSVQVGAFALEFNAEDLRQRLKKKGYDAMILPQKSSSGKTLHRVLVGRFSDHDRAGEKLLELAKKEDIEGFVTRIVK